MRRRRFTLAVPAHGSGRLDAMSARFGAGPGLSRATKRALSGATLARMKVVAIPSHQQAAGQSMRAVLRAGMKWRAGRAGKWLER